MMTLPLTHASSANAPPLTAATPVAIPSMHLEADISSLHADTGFVPLTPFREGIRKTIEWVRSEA